MMNSNMFVFWLKGVLVGKQSLSFELLSEIKKVLDGVTLLPETSYTIQNPNPFVVPFTGNPIWTMTTKN